MLPSYQRLSRSQVTALVSNPEIKVIFNRIGTLKYINSTTRAFTVVTGSKQQKKAVLRNKIRRQLYSIFDAYYQNTQKNLYIKSILYISKQVYTMSYQEIQENLYVLLSKIDKNS